MLVNMPSPSNYNKIFSRNGLRALINGELEIKHNKDLTYGEYIDVAYKQLSKHYRNEYYYKNTILNRRLLGVHSVNTAVALTEVPIVKSIADFILINGEAVVYEIKTELDDFSRLKDQLTDYYKAFINVYVVTAESKIEQLKSLLLDSPVGIIALRSNGSLSYPIKESQSYSDSLDHLALFKLLRKQEYLNITANFFDQVPNVQPVFLYDACFDLFQELDVEVAYSAVVDQLKNRNIREKDKIKKIPESIRSLAYFENLTSKAYDDLFMNLKKRME